MKFFILLTTGIIILTAGFMLYVRSTTRATIHSELSSRAKEYIEQRRNSNDQNWQETNVDKTIDPNSLPNIKTINEPGCFSLTVSIKASEVRKEGECQYKAFLTDPSGLGVFFKRALDVAAIEDVADVKMRRVYTDQYTEENVKVGERTYYVFSKLNDGYEKTAFLLENKQLYAFTIRAQTNRNLDEKFDAMLNSVKIYNE